ncbi:MAG: hypothetical protein N2484_01990 [Clostridia bacterium]|nr:hypothetical protein [Clostridia bacterium]
MLRRVFISLLILSALSSEGIINLPQDTFSIYFSYASLLGMNAEQLMSFETLTEEEADFVAPEINTQSEAFFTSKDDSGKSTSKNAIPVLGIQENISLMNIAHNLSQEPTTCESQKAVTQMTDSSPPALIA